MTEQPTMDEIATHSVAAFTFLGVSILLMGKFPGLWNHVMFTLFATVWWFAAGWLVDLYDDYWFGELNYESRKEEIGTITND